MSHHPASSTHPSNNTVASNIYHKTAPPGGGECSNNKDTKRSLHGSPSSHGGEIGFDLAATVIFSPDFLNVQSGDVYVDAGGGRGGTAIICKLINPRSRAVSVEIDKCRHEAGLEWLVVLNLRDT